MRLYSDMETTGRSTKSQIKFSVGILFSLKKGLFAKTTFRNSVDLGEKRDRWRRNRFTMVQDYLT